MASAVISLMSTSPPGASRNDDDIADRLNYRYTTLLLVSFAVIVSTTQYVGKPIKCWTPAHFTDNHATYTNHYCWVRNTYYLPMESYIPKQHEEGSVHRITYYQWMPLILLAQAFFFYAPVMFWRNLNARSGIDLNALIETGEAIQQMSNSDNKEQKLKTMSTQMDRYLSSMHSGHGSGCSVSIKSVLAKTCCRPFGRRRGNFLVVLYLFSKLIYIANVIGQLFVLNIFLGYDFSMYGFNILSELFQGEDWTSSERFPRVTMCDFILRRLGNLHRYTVQCVLPINLFNEKIYLFVWLWMVLVAAITCLSLVRWSLRAAFSRDRRIYIKRHLQFAKKLETESDRRALTRFIDNYLKQDGVFIMRLLGHNTNGVIVSEFAAALWDEYRGRMKSKIDMEDDTM